jgi:uncharacterized protein
LQMSPEFTPMTSLLGGGLIGLAAVLLMLTHGRIAGISGIAVRMFPPYLDREALGRLAFILGLVVAPALTAIVSGGWAPMSLGGHKGMLLISGLLVGFGSVWGNGCTSGHGVCGLARLSVRSLVAVAVFMVTAMIVVYFNRNGF